MTLAGPDTSFLKVCRAVQERAMLTAELLESHEAFVQALFRLLKNIQLHSMDNQAVQQSLTQAIELIKTCANSSGGIARVSFIGDSVCVCGHLLHAGRVAYESAHQLAQQLQEASVQEISFDEEISVDDLDAFCRSFIIATVKGREGFLVRTKFSHIEVAAHEAESEASEEGGESQPVNGTLRFFAEASAALQMSANAIESGEPFSSRGLKRIAQGLVRLVAEDPRGIRALLNWPAGASEYGVRVIKTAAVAVLTATAFSDDYKCLNQLVLSSFLAELARVGDQDASEEQRAARLVALGIKLGGVSQLSAQRLVVAYDALCWNADKSEESSIQARVLTMAQTYVSAISKDSEGKSKSNLDGLDAVSKSQDFDPLVFRAMVSRIGFFPLGTVLELDGKAWALVSEAGVSHSDFARPTVRLIADLRGNLVREMKEIALASGSGAGMKVTGVVSPNHYDFNLTSSLLQSESE